MRIVNIIQCTNLGGMEQASLRLMKALMKRGHELRIISLNAIGALGPQLENAGVPTRGLDYARRSKLNIVNDIRQAIRTERPEALIMTGHNLAGFMALGGICRGRRFLSMHYHHTGVMPNWRWRLIYRFAKQKFDCIAFPSDYVRREAETIYPPITAITMTLRNPLGLPGIPCATDRVKFRKSVDVPVDAALIGNAGWLIQRKRFDVFLSVASQVLVLRPDTYFVIAGDGEDRSALEERARLLGISHRVRWLGWQPDLTQFYAGIDVLLFNSDWDAFPTTPIEAMSRAIPVVASLQNGGLDEILDNTCGWFFSRHDCLALTAAVLEALQPAARTRAEAARMRVRATSDPNSIAQIVEAKLAKANHDKARRLDRS